MTYWNQQYVKAETMDLQLHLILHLNINNIYEFEFKLYPEHNCKPTLGL